MIRRDVAVNSKTIKEEWFSNVRADVLAGLVVALALIPEAIAFSILAGLKPEVGLYASFTIAVIISFVGGRPAMISAATGAMALLMKGVTETYGPEVGLQYILAATILTGVLQFTLSFFKIGNLMKFISKAVMTGFVNALAIVIFMAQLPELGFTDKFEVTWLVWPLTAVGLAIIYLFPLLTKAIPSPLVCIVVLTTAVSVFNIDVRTVGELATGKDGVVGIPSSLPSFHLPEVELSRKLLAVIVPLALSLVAVGLLESFMTAQIVDDLTDTDSDKDREARGQGIANFVTGFFGGMAGCAMIGQSVINVKSGGRTRLSTFLAGFVLIILCIVLGPLVAMIPMPALVAVMIMVSIGTFSWSSFRNLFIHPPTTSIVMLATVGCVIATHNLAIGVGVGVLLSAVFFARKVAQLISVESELSSDGETRSYRVKGQLFFASSDGFVAFFDFKEVVSKVVIDVSEAHFWDLTSVGALDKIVFKFRREGAEVEVLGMNQASATIVGKLGTHHQEGATGDTGGH